MLDLFVLGSLVFWIALSIVAGVVAEAKGRVGIGYIFLSLILSPIIGILLVALLPSRVTQATAAAAATAGPTTRCDACAEVVLLAANKCKHCGHDLVPAREAREAAAAAEINQQRAHERQQLAARAEKAQGVGRAVGGLFRRK